MAVNKVVLDFCVVNKLMVFPAAPGSAFPDFTDDASVVEGV